MVCDGHGQMGHQISEFIKVNVIEMIQKRLNDLKYIEKVLMEMIETIDTKLKNSKLEVYLSGSTLNLVFLNKSTMEVVCANVGDSRSILFNSQSIYELSNDHKPDDRMEYNRITQRGGLVH